MMKKRKERLEKASIFFVTMTYVFGVVCFVSAAGYTTHEEIPGSGGGTNSFSTFLQQLYNFGLGSAAILAIIMIGAGAFIYIVTSAGNASKMANGKNIIMSALYGLGIALIAHLMLFLINPDLINIDVGNVPETKDCIDSGTCGL